MYMCTNVDVCISFSVSVYIYVFQKCKIFLSIKLSVLCHIRQHGNTMKPTNNCCSDDPSGRETFHQFSLLYRKLLQELSRRLLHQQRSEYFLLVHLIPTYWFYCNHTLDLHHLFLFKYTRVHIPDSCS